MYKIILLPLLLLAFNLSYAQVISKEVVKTDSVDHNMTISETGMYHRLIVAKAKIYFDKAARYGEKEDFKKAIKWYKKAIKEDALYAEAYDNIGLIHRQLGGVEQAVMYYKKSIEVYPEGVTAHQNLAAAYVVLKAYESAILEYKKILKLSPDNPEGYFGLANSNMMLSNFDVALDNAHQALDLYKKVNSHFVGDAYQVIGMIYYYKKEHEKAKTYLQKAKDLGVQIHPQLEKDLFTKEANEPRMETLEDYAKLETEVLAAFNWLLKTPIEQEVDERKKINRFLLQWISGSPTVSIEINSLITGMDCPDCLMIFMAGWTTFAIKNEGETTKLAGNMAGITAVIQFYTQNKKNIGKKKVIEKWIKRQKKGKLEQYIIDNL